MLLRTQTHYFALSLGIRVKDGSSNSARETEPINLLLDLMLDAGVERTFENSCICGDAGGETWNFSARHGDHSCGNAERPAVGLSCADWALLFGSETLP